MEPLQLESSNREPRTSAHSVLHSKTLSTSTSTSTSEAALPRSLGPFSSSLQPRLVHVHIHIHIHSRLAASQLRNMSDQAQRRIKAIGGQLQDSNPASSSTRLPTISRVAGASSGLRAEGKVVIITGTGHQEVRSSGLRHHHGVAFVLSGRLLPSPPTGRPSHAP